MLMRTTSSQMSNSLVNYMASTQGKFNQLTTQLSTQKKINSITDDAVSAKSILTAKKEINLYNSYIENMKTAQFELRAVDDTMKASNTQATRARDIAMMVSNGTYSETELDGFKLEIDGIIQTMTSLANTEYGDGFLFSGTATLQRPFSSSSNPVNVITDNGDGTYHVTRPDGSEFNMKASNAGGTYKWVNTADNSDVAEKDLIVASNTINYNGTDEERKILIGEGGLEEQISIIGSDIYGKGTVNTTFACNPETGEATSKVNIDGEAGLLASLSQLSSAIEANDITAIREAMDGITKGVDTLAESKAQMGIISNRFDNLMGAYDNSVMNLTNLKSSLEDADLAALVSDWMQSQYALEASYSISSQLMNISIMNYI